MKYYLKYSYIYLFIIIHIIIYIIYIDSVYNMEHHYKKLLIDKSLRNYAVEETNQI